MKKCRYKRTVREWIQTGAVGLLLAVFLGLLFYRHPAGIVLLLTLTPLYLKEDGKQRQARFLAEMGSQFQDALTGMSGAMQAGCSMEKAVKEAVRELVTLHGEKSPLAKAFAGMNARLEMNETVEQAFVWLGEDTGVPEIQEFAQVLQTAKRTGGNLIRVMEHTAACMGMQQEVKREIRTVIAGKRLEARLMNLLLPGILLYLSAAMPELTGILYHNPFGVCLMTGLLLIYGGSCLWTGKIVQIKI